jgi:hypothetical protein
LPLQGWTAWLTIPAVAASGGRKENGGVASGGRKENGGVADGKTTNPVVAASSGRKKGHGGSMQDGTQLIRRIKGRPGVTLHLVTHWVNKRPIVYAA